MAVLIVEGKAHQLVSSKGKVIGNPVLLLSLLHRYRTIIIIIVIIIDQMGFTLSIITSVFKHQWPFVFQVQLRELPTI